MSRVRFVVVFVLLLAAFEFLLLLDIVDKRVIVPFTGAIARVSADVITRIERDVQVKGTVISSPCFAVNIQNGCNGVEATMFIAAAVLAFPATWPKKVGGVIVGAVLMQIANFLRVVTLFEIGCHRRAWFATFHLAIWQTVIFAVAVGFFILWTRQSGQTNAARA